MGMHAVKEAASGLAGAPVASAFASASVMVRIATRGRSLAIGGRIAWGWLGVRRREGTPDQRF